MTARDVRKNANLFFDGRGYAGQLTEFNPPKLTLKTEEFRGGGMDLPIDITQGMEKLTTDFSLKCYDRHVLSWFGVSEGNEVPFVVREALESFDGTVKTVKHTMRGKITEIDPGTTKPGESPEMKVSMTLSYYKLEHNGVVVHEIDPVNMVRVIGGNDLLSAIRDALGF